MGALRIWIALPFVFLGVFVLWLASLIAGDSNTVAVFDGIEKRVAR